jgi:hypothetical protein
MTSPHKRVEGRTSHRRTATALRDDDDDDDDDHEHDDDDDGFCDDDDGDGTPPALRPPYRDAGEPKNDAGDGDRG